MSKRILYALMLLIAIVIVACGAPATPAPANTAAPAPANTTAPAPAATTSTGAVTPGLPADAATLDKQVLKIAWAGFGSQESLAPWSVRWGGQAVSANEFMTPLYPDVDFNFKPLLATAITANADKTVWTLKVDPRAVWSDGKKLTAADIKASWEWSAADPKLVTNLATQIGGLKGYTDVSSGKAKEITGLVAKDDATLEMTIDPGDPFFDTKLAHYAVGVLPADKLRADAQYLTKPNPVVNGPFQVVSIDATGRQVVMKQNPKWWGAKPLLQEIDLIVAEEQTAFETLMEKGQVDFTYSFAGAAATRALEARAKGTTELATKLPSGVYSAFHANVPPNDDLNVRKALVHAIDFKALATAATEGLQKPWLAFLHPELKLGCYDKDVEATYFKFDVAQAKQEIAASKYGSVDKFPKMRVSSNSTGASQQKAVQIIMEMWRTNLGITNIEFQTQPSGFGPDEKNLNVDRQSLAARPPDDGLWITQLMSTQIHATRFMGGYKNEALDKQLTAILPMDRKDPNLCKAIQAAEKTFLDDYMWLPLWRTSGDFGLVQPWVKNVFFGPYLVPYGWFDSPQAYITNAKK